MYRLNKWDTTYGVFIVSFTPCLHRRCGASGVLAENMMRSGTVETVGNLNSRGARAWHTISVVPSIKWKKIDLNGNMLQTVVTHKQCKLLHCLCSWTDSIKGVSDMCDTDDWKKCLKCLLCKHTVRGRMILLPVDRVRRAVHPVCAYVKVSYSNWLLQI